MNFLGIIDDQGGFSGYIVVAGQIEVDAAGDTWDQTYRVMTVGADGTVVSTSPENHAHATRLQVIPEGGMGTPLAEMPTWVPASADATPTA